MNTDMLLNRAKKYTEAKKSIDDFRGDDKQAFADWLELKQSAWFFGLTRGHIGKSADLEEYENLKHELWLATNNLLSCRGLLDLPLIFSSDEECIRILMEMALQSA